MTPGNDSNGHVTNPGVTNPGVTNPGRLRRALESGRFVVTAEIGPPRGADPGAIASKAELLRGWVDAANVTDNQSAHVRLSSLAGSLLAHAAGVEPVMQLTCRDRNRNALQSDLLSAATLGIPNILLRGVPADRVADEGMQICIEIIQRLTEISGVAGAHVMAFSYERGIPEILERAGIGPRPDQAVTTTHIPTIDGSGRAG